MKKFYQILILFLFAMFFFQSISLKVYSLEPEEILTDKNDELRARNISKNIRCLVCQNQSIDESSAPLAKDLRKIIRKKIVEKKTDEEIYQFLTQRYGDFILLNPPFNISTIILWFAPFIFFLIAGIIIYKSIHRSK